MAATEQDGGELAALKELVSSEGWQLLKARAYHEWGPSGYGRKMREAISGVQMGGDRALAIAEAAERVEAGAQAVDGLFVWVTQRIKDLTPAAASMQPFARLRRQRT